MVERYLLTRGDHIKTIYLGWVASIYCSIFINPFACLSAIFIINLYAISNIYLKWKYIFMPSEGNNNLFSLLNNFLSFMTKFFLSLHLHIRVRVWNYLLFYKLTYFVVVYRDLSAPCPFIVKVMICLVVLLYKSPSNKVMWSGRKVMMRHEIQYLKIIVLVTCSSKAILLWLVNNN